MPHLYDLNPKLKPKSVPAPKAAKKAPAKKAKGKKEKAEATLKALKDRYSEWCRQALTNSSKVKKRTALIQEDLDKVIAEWQSSGVIE